MDGPAGGPGEHEWDSHDSLGIGVSDIDTDGLLVEDFLPGFDGTEQSGDSVDRCLTVNDGRGTTAETNAYNTPSPSVHLHLEWLTDHPSVLPPAEAASGPGASGVASPSGGAMYAAGKRKHNQHDLNYSAGSDHSYQTGQTGQTDQLLAQLRGVVGGGSTEETLTRALAQLSGGAPPAQVPIIRAAGAACSFPDAAPPGVLALPPVMPAPRRRRSSDGHAAEQAVPTGELSPCPVPSLTPQQQRRSSGSSDSDQDAEQLQWISRRGDYRDDGAAASMAPGAGWAGLPPVQCQQQMVGKMYGSHGFAMVVMDMSGNFVLWNSMAQTLMGCSFETMSGLSMRQVTHAEDMPRMKRMIQGITQMHTASAIAQMPSTVKPVIMPKRILSSIVGGHDCAVPVRLSILSESDAVAIGLPSVTHLHVLLDCHVRVSPYAWRMPVADGTAGVPAGWHGGGHGAAAAAAAAADHQHHQHKHHFRLKVESSKGGPALQRPANRRRRTRVPLPAGAVAELRQLVAAQRHPSVDARDELARRHQIDRRRVDKWLENARAREGRSQHKKQAD